MGDHLIVLHSAVRACPGYSRHEAPSILMDGSSVARDTEHGRAIAAQITRRHGTLEEAIEAGVFALGAAGLSKGIRRQARAACEDYFYDRLSLTPSSELGGREEITDSLEHRLKYGEAAATPTEAHKSQPREWAVLRAENGGTLRSGRRGSCCVPRMEVVEALLPRRSTSWPTG